MKYNIQPRAFLKDYWMSYINENTISLPRAFLKDYKISYMNDFQDYYKYFSPLCNTKFFTALFSTYTNFTQKF